MAEREGERKGAAGNEIWEALRNTVSGCKDFGF